jgi:hypothetical protein
MLTLITQNGTSRGCELWSRAEGASLAFRLLHKLIVKYRMGTSRSMLGYVALLCDNQPTLSKAYTSPIGSKRDLLAGGDPAVLPRTSCDRERI